MSFSLKIKPSYCDSGRIKTSDFKLHAVFFAGAIPTVSPNETDASGFHFQVRRNVSASYTGTGMAYVATDDGNINADSRSATEQLCLGAWARDQV